MKPKPSSGDFLTAEEILEFGKDRFPKSRFRVDTPPGVTTICAYCGAETKMYAYTDLKTGKVWPACCSHEDCIDQWWPLKN